jgi:hypothetical protein
MLLAAQIGLAVSRRRVDNVIAGASIVSTTRLPETQILTDFTTTCSRVKAILRKGNGTFGKMAEDLRQLLDPLSHL